MYISASRRSTRGRSDDGTTLVFNDLLWTPPHHGPLAVVYRWLRQGPEVPWLAMRLFVSDAAALRAWLLKLAQIDGLTRLVPGHGALISRNASEVLRQVATGI
jgi:hypothetical protein